jgi:hypothetical protein
MTRFNKRFAIRAAKPENLHRPLNVAPSRLNEILPSRAAICRGAAHLPL